MSNGISKICAKFVLQITVLVLLCVLPAEAEDIGSVQMGINVLINNQFCDGSWRKFEVQPIGIAVGFLLPINFPYVDAHYKVRVASHDIKEVRYKNSYYTESNDFKKYATGINELLIGKKIQIRNSIDLLPQIGFGFIAETIYKKRGVGIVYDLFFIDFSVLFRYSFDDFGVGLMVNYENGFLTSKEDYQAKQRINIALVFSK